MGGADGSDGKAAIAGVTFPGPLLHIEGFTAAVPWNVGVNHPRPVIA